MILRIILMGHKYQPLQAVQSQQQAISLFFTAQQTTE
jgi:hypothetical protein